MGENAKNAREKIGEGCWNMIMDSVDGGTFTAQKMADFSFALGPKVGGNHERRTGPPQRLPSDRSEMASIFGDWWQVDDKFEDMSQDEVILKLIALFKTDDIGLNPLARKLAKTLDSNKAGAAGGPVLESIRAREPGLQAPSNLTGSKIKNTHIFLPLLIFSQRYKIQYLEEHPTW